ncbi:hypothetical protein ACEPAI_1348 [Sanghuangporus weigelae]
MLSSANGHGRVLKSANPNTIQDKFLVGYQGWFTCGGDGPPVHKGHHGWLHWFNKPLPDGGKASFDLWPDVSAYTPSELFPAPGLTLSSGSPALLFSSRHPQTVQRHFHWMAEHSVDGAFYQRFAGQCEVDGRTEGATADIMRLRDEVLDRVREAAEKEGRVWAVMYDVSGVANDRIEKVIKVDWNHLLWDKRILDSPNYLKEGGRPVIALWGFGFAGRGHSPDTVRKILRHIRSVTPGGAYIMAGTPTHWRMLRADADPNPEFLSVWYNEFDAISPWTVGRFHNEETIDRFAKEKLLPDFQALQDPANTQGRKVDYIPVVLPGASGFNLSDGRWALNEQPRDGGRFLWRQLYHVLKRTIQAKIVYGAMWDEYDEGTAFLPAVSKKRELPVEAQGRFIALDADGYDLPPDWYMRIAGFAGEMIRGEKEVHETFPVKDLQDYWSSRPKYEPAPSGPSSAEPSGSGIASGSGSGNENVGQTFDEWCAQEKEGVDDLPPPPYTLEADSSSAPTVAPHPSQTQSQSQNPSQQEHRNEGGPPVPLQTRPVSFSASQMSTSESTAPSSEHGRPQVSLASRPSLSSHPPAPAPSIASRPNSLPSSSTPALPGAPPSQTSSYEPPYQVYTSVTRPHSHHNHQHQHGHHNEAGYAPMYVVPGQASPNAPPTPTPQNQPNWSTRPHSGPQAPLMMLSLSDQFGRQSLHDTSSMGTGSAPSSAQWPPPEWGMPSQTCPAPGPPPRPPSSSRPSSSRPPSLSRPSTSVSTSPRPATLTLPPPPLPPPLHPSRPGGPPSRPPPSPSSGPNFARASSTSPNPPLRLSPSPRPGPSHSPGPSMPSPGSGSGPGWAPSFNPSSDSSYDADYGRMPSASFPLPHSQAQHQAPYAHHMMPPSPLESASSSSVYPSAYPDVTQGYMNTMPAQPSGPGAGGFYMGPHPPPPPRRYPAHSQYPGSVAETSPGPGSIYSPPPQAPPARPLGHTPSISPGQIMPGTAPASVSSPSPSPSQMSQHPQHQHQQEDPTSPQTQGPGPGGFLFTDAYTRTLGAVDKFAGTNTRKKIEGGIESLSSAGSKVYQRFRG